MRVTGSFPIAPGRMQSYLLEIWSCFSGDLPERYPGEFLFDNVFVTKRNSFHIWSRYEKTETHTHLIVLQLQHDHSVAAHEYNSEAVE